MLGADACRAGWVGALWRGDGAVEVWVAASIDALVRAAARAERPVVVGIDIPIGLPDRGRRAADVEARAALPGKGSSVFPTLVRAAYAAPTYAEGRAAMRAATAEDRGGPRACSSQAWHLGRKVLEVDDWARRDPGVRVVEVHPEVSLAAMAGAPLLASKKSPQGQASRREALRTAGVPAPEGPPPRGAAVDDVLDACAVAWTARRVATGRARCLPDPPERFSDGWPAAIHV